MTYIQLKADHQDFMEGELLTLRQYSDYVIDTGYSIPSDFIRTIDVKARDTYVYHGLRFLRDYARPTIVKENGAI